MNVNILGVDPGADGAACLITPDHKVSVFGFGKIETNSDMIKLIKGLTAEPCHAFLEKVHSFPGQGVASTFKFGFNYGFVTAALMAVGTPIEDVIPGRWQRGVGLGKSYPTQADRKRAHKQLAQQWFPHLPITLANADAVLIAEYAYRMFYSAGEKR